MQTNPKGDYVRCIICPQTSFYGMVLRAEENRLLLVELNFEKRRLFVFLTNLFISHKISIIHKFIHEQSQNFTIFRRISCR